MFSFSHERTPRPARAAPTARCASREIRSARIVLSAAAAIPWRALDAERALEGRKLDRATITSAASVAVKGAQPLDKNAYKVALFQGILEETLEKLAG
jgi:xanthine dehydrogenase YagS FAD-binding subunit